MKKRVIFLLNTILWSTIVAQEYQYIPIPTSDATWNVFYVPPASVVPGHPELYIAYNNEYSTAGDTLINGAIWTKIVLTSSSTILHHKGATAYQGAYIETDKIIRFCTPDGIITTLYDFNLQVGDTVKFLHFEDANNPIYFPQDTCLIVKQIDYILIQSHYRKCIIFKPILTGDMRCLEEKWIEGIGSTHGVLFPLNIRPLIEEINEKEDLTCFFNNNELMWQNSLYNRCELIKINDLTVIDQIEIFPNPASHFFNIKTPDEFENFLPTIELWDMIGNMVLILSYNLFEKNHQIDISQIRSGIYLLVIYIDDKRITKKLIIY
ncbi:MAG: T9SS type A sorting domain-containing protein [Spirochaetaceae bacterium]|nr:T9SS type A sorting domain-containing protein [Spirochaetaceae bacterium]